MLLSNFTVIALFEQLGETLRQLIGLPVPGPVIGMALLWMALISHGELPEGFDSTADGILRYLPILFVPAGVGAMGHFETLRAQWPAIAAAIIGSSVVAVAVTAATMLALDRWQQSRRKLHERDRFSSGMGGVQ